MTTQDTIEAIKEEIVPTEVPKANPIAQFLAGKFIGKFFVLCIIVGTVCIVLLI